MSDWRELEVAKEFGCKDESPPLHWADSQSPARQMAREIIRLRKQLEIAARALKAHEAWCSGLGCGICNSLKKILPKKRLVKKSRR